MNYIGTCKDRNDNNIRVEIITSNGNSNREITIVEDGITISYDSDSIFKPIKKSGATIEILTEYLVEDFYTGTLLDPKVYIYKNGTLIWFGYISPTVFTQPFVKQKESLTLNCIDTLANLENVDYTYLNGAVSVTKFIDLIKHILDKTDPNKTIKSIFCTQSISCNNTNNILNELACMERNFSDEIEDIMKCDEVIEEICKYLGVCMFQYKDAYYIIDYNKLNSSYTKFDRGEQTTTNVLTPTPISISTIGVGAADASITLDGVYNRITVIANTLKTSNPIESAGDSDDENTTTDIFANMTLNNDFNGEYETVDIWVNTNVDRNYSSNFYMGGIDFMTHEDTFPRKDNVWDTVAHDGWKHYKYLDAWFKIGSQWTIQYDGIMWATQQSGIGTSVDVYNGGLSFAKATETFLNSGNSREYRWAPDFQWNGTNTKNDGIAIQKVFTYDADGEIPTQFKWDTYLTMPLKSRHTGLEDYIIKLVKPTAPYKGGTLIINFEFMFTDDENIAAPSIIPVRNWEYDDTINTSFNAFNGHTARIKERKIVFPAKLRIGNHYWNGTQWKEYTTQFYQKMQAGYFNRTIIVKDYNSEGIEYIYRIWNSTWNGWEYCHKSVYDAFSGQKETIEVEHFTNTGWDDKEYSTGIRYMVKDTTNNKVWYAPQEYYDEYISDRFFLYKKFDNGDRVYNTKYKLTNTATYDLHLSDNATGMAISLPTNETFSGDFEFSFSRPTRHFEALTPGQTCGESISGDVMHISDLYVKYSTSNDTQSVFEDKNNNNNDITYSNEINSGYVQDYDDIQLKVNTYNANIQSFSYVLDKDSNYVENITYNGSLKKMEQHLIDKYVSHFSTPKFKYCGTLHDVNITPCSVIHQSQLNKDLAIYKTSYHILSNTVEVESVEI